LLAGTALELVDDRQLGPRRTERGDGRQCDHPDELWRLQRWYSGHGTKNYLDLRVIRDLLVCREVDGVLCGEAHRVTSQS
jgi:hypothetical protein